MKKMKTTLAQRQASKRFRDKNPELCSKQYKSWAQRNPEKRKDIRFRSRYGITLDKFNEILIEQKYKCKICDKTQEQLGKCLHVDHCHKTNKIRGLLCGKCNKGIGLFNDNVFLLDKASLYLKEQNGN